MSALTSRLGVLAFLLLAGAAGGAWMMRPPPGDLDLSLTKPTKAGLYVATIAPVAEPVTVGPMHAWTVSIRSADGRSPSTAACPNMGMACPPRRR